MTKITSEKTQQSKDRRIIKDFGYKEFALICQEYNIIEKAMKRLIAIAESNDTPIRLKTDIYKWIVEMNIGKPSRNIYSEQAEKKKIEGYTFEIVNASPPLYSA